MGGGSGLGLGMGMGGGQGMGPRPSAQDDKPFEKERVRSGLSGSGEINDVQTFKGIPKEGESRVELKRMLRSAAQDAEEALGQEEIPRRRREAVKSYFEGVSPK